MADEVVAGAPALDDTDIIDIHADETAGELETGEPANPKEGESVEEHKKRLSGAQRNKLRIERLETELQEERQERQKLLDHVLKQAPAEKKEPAAPVEDKRPRKEDFIVDKEAGTYDADKYESAVDEWRDRQYEKKLSKALDEREQSKSQKSEQERIEQTWREREAPVEAANADYKELSTIAITFLKQNGTSPTVQAIGAAITESEAGPQLLRHLGDEYETLQKLAKLSPMAAVRELGKIEARLAPEESAEKEEDETDPPVPPVKQPPKPPTPVRKVAAVTKPDINDPKLPYPEFVRLREESLKKKGK